MSKSIVIVGAGIFGVNSANAIYEALTKTGLKDINVKLISTSSFFYFLPSSVRLLTTGDFSSSFTPLKKVVNPNIETIIGKVTEFDENAVIIDNDKKLDFDVLVLATGSNRPEPISTTYKFGDDYKSYFENQRANISKAKNIVFIGGGLTNVEIVGELVDLYSNEIKQGEKKITMIMRGPSVLGSGPAFTEKYRNAIKKFLENNKVKLIFNAKPEIVEKTKVLIDEDHEIEADLIFANTGIKPLVPKNSLKDLTNSKGAVKIENTLQSTARKNIFAIGDVTDFNYKGLFKTKEWSQTLGNNVINYLQGKPLQSTSDIDTTRPLLNGISLGPSDGCAQIPLIFGLTFLLPKYFIVRAKSQNLIVHVLRDLEKY